MFSDRQSQAGAADFARARHVNAVEALEDAGLIRPRDANAGVGNRKDYFGAVRRSTNHDLAAGGSALHGVVEQILECFGETTAVGGNVRQMLPPVDGEAKIFSICRALPGFS